MCIAVTKLTELTILVFIRWKVFFLYITLFFGFLNFIIRVTFFILGVRTFSANELFGNQQVMNEFPLFAFTDKERIHTVEKQECHSEDASKVLIFRLKNTLEDLARFIFGENIEFRWVDAYFPFTHPSFELEILFNDKWLEVLGCGVMQQKILDLAGTGSKVGFAFGLGLFILKGFSILFNLGLERLAMTLYDIPDIRLFWSKDTGFLHQFKDLKPEDNYKYKIISVHPQLSMDLSFWIPLEHLNITTKEMQNKFNGLKSDVRDVIRNLGGDLVEQVDLIDEFLNEKKRKFGHCYRIVYRSNERPLTKDEINVVHKKIESKLTTNFGVEIR